MLRDGILPGGVSKVDEVDGFETGDGEVESPLVVSDKSEVSVLSQPFGRSLSFDSFTPRVELKRKRILDFKMRRTTDVRLC